MKLRDRVRVLNSKLDYRNELVGKVGTINELDDEKALVEFDKDVKHACLNSKGELKHHSQILKIDRLEQVDSSSILEKEKTKVSPAAEVVVNVKKEAPKNEKKMEEVKMGNDTGILKRFVGFYTQEELANASALSDQIARDGYHKSKSIVLKDGFSFNYGFRKNTVKRVTIKRAQKMVIL